MAGHYAAMSEIALRGYNVAIPSIDVGDDVIAIDDKKGNFWRIQVKTGEPRRVTSDSRQMTVHYNLSRKQLKEVKSSELWFFFMVRCEDRWRFICVPRDKLDAIRDRYVAARRQGEVGAKPKSNAKAKTDMLGLDITWTADDATGWKASFREHMDVWPTAFPDLRAVSSTQRQGSTPAASVEGLSQSILLTPPRLPGNHRGL
jgi:hypothetical protein